jgi:hypothetical protein
MFLWGRVRPWLRPLVALYPLAMGLTLIATGEHYFFDVLLGWLYAGGVMAGWSWVEERRARRSETGARPPAQAGAETEARVPRPHGPGRFASPGETQTV